VGSISRIRILVEVFAAVAAIGFLLASLIVPDWIELAFGFAPDEGDGSIEWGLSAIAVATFLVSAWLAGRAWRLARGRTVSG
jgi:hypothetical protein